MSWHRHTWSVEVFKDASTGLEFKDCSRCQHRIVLDPSVDDYTAKAEGKKQTRLSPITFEELEKLLPPHRAALTICSR